MLEFKRKDVAIIPIFDTERIGSLVKPISLNSVGKKKIIVVMDPDNDKVILETEDEEKALTFMRKRKRDGKRSKYQMKDIVDETPIPVGERCDQGIVKYIGKDVKDVERGDYVFFSGYSGTLLSIEDEGLLIVMEERFVICKYPVDQNMQIPGLYFMDAFGRPIEATFEVAMNIIASTFTALGKTVDVQSETPKLEDYNVETPNLS